MATDQSPSTQPGSLPRTPRTALTGIPISYSRAPGNDPGDCLGRICGTAAARKSVGPARKVDPNRPRRYSLRVRARRAPCDRAITVPEAQNPNRCRGCATRHGRGGRTIARPDASGGWPLPVKKKLGDRLGIASSIGSEVARSIGTKNAFTPARSVWTRR